MSISNRTSDALGNQGVGAQEVATLLRRAYLEDLADGVDVTTVATVPATSRSQLDLVARAEGVACGTQVAAAALEFISDSAEVTVHVEDGARVSDGEVLVSATGPTRDLLTAERTALNLIGRLSGIATATRAWSDALEGTPCQVRDTRKTTPLLRFLEKYAVRCGGGANHRMSLSDEALIKDNHILAAGGVVEAYRAVRSTFPEVPVQVEVDDLDQLAAVLDAGADRVLLDNFTVDQLRTAVELTAGRATLEASGGLTLANAAEVAATGVDFVAVGALTHSSPVLDIGGDLRTV